MAISLIGTSNNLKGYDKYSIMHFKNFDTFEDFAKKSNDNFGDSQLDEANAKYWAFVESQLRNNKTLPYGMFGKHPKSVKEAMDRNKYVYWDEYKQIKKEVEAKVREKLALSSQAEVMKPKMVFNDKQIGEFIYDRAAMALEPQIFFYSPSKKREIDLINEKVEQKNGKYYLESDNSIVIQCLKVELDDGKVEYVELEGEQSLTEAVKKGVVSVTSSNKKVYLYKENKPRMFNSVQLIVSLTAGGFTAWDNDFYTGVAAVIILEVLESLGYSVQMEVVAGGGRCGGCARKLNFGGKLMRGRRFFVWTLKDFNEQADLDTILYNISDPSFHNIKFMRYLNSMFNLFGDQYDRDANPAITWHGVETTDLVHPVGTYLKYRQFKKGNKDLLNFYVSKVANSTDVLRQVVDMVLLCEDININAIKKYSTHDYGLGA